MKSFPALSRIKRQYLERSGAPSHLNFLYPVRQKNRDEREYSVETAQPSARARSTAPGLTAERASRGTSDHERRGTY